MVDLWLHTTKFTLTVRYIGVPLCHWWIRTVNVFFFPFFKVSVEFFFFCKFRNLYARSLLPYFDHAFFPAPFFLLHTVQSGMTAVVVGTIPEQLLIPAVTESCFCTTLKRSRRSEFCHSKFLYYSEDFLGDQFFILAIMKFPPPLCCW